MKDTTIHSHSEVVQELKRLLAINPEMELALLASLNVASIKAESALNKDLYAALNDEFNGNAWPTTIEGPSFAV